MLIPSVLCILRDLPCLFGNASSLNTGKKLSELRHLAALLPIFYPGGRVDAQVSFSKKSKSTGGIVSMENHVPFERVAWIPPDEFASLIQHSRVVWLGARLTKYGVWGIDGRTWVSQRGEMLMNGSMAHWPTGVCGCVAGGFARPRETDTQLRTYTPKLKRPFHWT